MVLPVPLSGTGQLPPGACADRIQLLNWSVARQGRFKKSKLLQLLGTMPLAREPVLRQGLMWTSDAFNEKIGESITKVEAAYIQCVGRINKEECEACLKEEGPFNTCVVIDILGWPKQCANCHWRSESHLCNFYKPHGSEPLVITQTNTNAAVPMASPRPQEDSPSRDEFMQHLKPLKNAVIALSNAHDRSLSAIDADKKAWFDARATMNSALQKSVDDDNQISSTDLQSITADISIGNRQNAAVQTAADDVTRRFNDLAEAFSELEKFIRGQ